jgi:hypothetical protein
VRIAYKNGRKDENFGFPLAEREGYVAVSLRETNAALPVGAGVR